MFSCVRTVTNLLIWRAEVGKSVFFGGRGGAGTEIKFKEGQTAIHMIFFVIRNL